MTQALHPNTREADAGGWLQTWGQPELAWNSCLKQREIEQNLKKGQTIRESANISFVLIFLSLGPLNFLNLFFFHILHPNPVSPSLSPNTPSPPDPLLPLSLQTRASLPWISTKHGISRGNKTRYICSHQGWMRHLNWRKWDQKQKSKRQPPTFTAQSPAGISSYATIKYMQRT